MVDNLRLQKSLVDGLTKPNRNIDQGIPRRKILVVISRLVDGQSFYHSFLKWPRRQQIQILNPAQTPS